MSSGQRVASAAKALGIIEQTLANWVKADKLGQLRGLSSEQLSAERMENIRLRAELARVTMERDILHPTDEDLSTGTPVWEKLRRTSRSCSDEVRLDGATQAALAGERTVPGSERERVGISSTPGAAEEVLTRRHLSETALLVEVRAVYAEARGLWMAPYVAAAQGLRRACWQAPGPACNCAGTASGAVVSGDFPYRPPTAPCTGCRTEPARAQLYRGCGEHRLGR